MTTDPFGALAVAVALGGALPLCAAGFLWRALAIFRRVG